MWFPVCLSVACDFGQIEFSTKVLIGFFKVFIVSTATKVRTALTLFVTEYLCCVIPYSLNVTLQNNKITWKAIKAVS